MGFFGRFWILFVLLASFLRVGEAQNPGPIEELVIGSANPSGINGKVQSFLDLPPGIWSVAETQATQPVFDRFYRELRAFQAPARSVRMCHGAFAPLRSNSRVAGAWTGVAQLGDCAMKQLVLPWRGHEWTSGRLMVSSFHLGGHCLLGGTVYAPPRGPTYTNATALTSELLDTVTQELALGASGPRFIAGDMNVDTMELPAFASWRALGWKEAQELAFERYGRARQPTSKGVAIRDHLWLSPELAHWFDSVDCLHEVFSDHSPLLARFSVPLSTAWQHVWPQPAVLPWNEMQGRDLTPPAQSPYQWAGVDLTASFASWSHQAESELVPLLSQYTTVPDHCRGRGQTTEVTKRPVTHVPIPSGRHGDRVPRSHVASRAVHLWFKQVRRFQAYLQRAKTGLQTPTLQHDQGQTWRAIVAASGFGSSFVNWWAHRSVQLHGSPSLFPALPPSRAMAEVLMQDMEANYRVFESWHVRQRHKIIQAIAC